MRRLLMIAGREYGAYVRTFGFWLSICLMPVGMVAAVAAPMMMERGAPVLNVALIDLTGQGTWRHASEATTPGWSAYEWTPSPASPLARAFVNRTLQSLLTAYSGSPVRCAVGFRTASQSIGLAS